MVNKVLGRMVAASPGLRKALWRNWYQLLARRYRQADWTFMNYGYAELDETEDANAKALAADPDRYSRQLYHHVAGAMDLRGLRVLEVGCGRGGGSAYIARALEPKMMIGLDFSAHAVAFCCRTHQYPNLTFQQGDAEALPFHDAEFDAVVNVESSHCYGAMDVFLREARRVLKPGGGFLWADMMGSVELEPTQQEFRESGLQVCRELDITANVVHALDLANDAKRALIRRRAPRFLVAPVEDFAGVKGTRVYDDLRTRATLYRSAVARKPVE